MKGNIFDGRTKLHCWVLVTAILHASAATAQTLQGDALAASTPYMPSWQSRHAIEFLIDRANLQLTSSHWPLPSLAVGHALGAVLLHDPAAIAAKQVVMQDIEQQNRATVAVHNVAEGARGYGEHTAPATHVAITSNTRESTANDGLTWATRLGLQLSPKSAQHAELLPLQATGHSPAVGLNHSAAAVGWQGWQLQAFQHQHWWGPGWQSSLVNGTNNSPWLAAGIQRSSTQASTAPWLAWMGPWNFDIFIAQAQDPWVTRDQPKDFWFSGARLTLRPKPWLEVGLSRGMQFGGDDRPGGLANFGKALFGQAVNKNNDQRSQDSSGQIAGYDIRIRCPQPWASCAFYTQWMGEDAAGHTPPWPYKFMSLWGAQTTWGNGRYRLFGEYVDTHAFSLPWDQNPPFAGYINGVYRQGYTNGGRWAGSSFGAGSRVLTFGLMDAQSQTQLLLHRGTIGNSIGTFTPQTPAPRGAYVGLDLSRTFQAPSTRITPSLSYTHLSTPATPDNRHLSDWHIGLTVQWTLP